MKADPTVVSLFSGAGGMDIGLERAGWRVLAQLEMEHDAAETLRSAAACAVHDRQVIEDRIERVDPLRLRDSLGLRPGDLDLLAGGPPCQPFTTSGLRGALHDRRAASLFPAYLAFIEVFRPKALLIENVDGMLSAALRHRPLSRRGGPHAVLAPEEQKGSFLQWFLGELAARGYSVSWGVIEAADHGVPQLRQRAILIGVSGSSPCFLPAPTHGWPGLPPHRTLREALAGLDGRIGAIQPLSARKRAVFSQIPPGGNWRNLPDHIQRETMGAAYAATGGKSGWWRRLQWDAPAPTILGMPDHSSTALIHPDEVRCLSVNECAAVQTFPPEATIAGRPRSKYQQVGNAVPPTLAFALGRHLLDWFGGIPTEIPPPPVWRQISANRRIGTHGWVETHPKGPRYHLTAKAREDHVWFVRDADRQGELALG